MKFVETHIEQKVTAAKEIIKRDIGISDLQQEVVSLKRSYADEAGSEVSVSSSNSGIDLNIIIRNLNYDSTEQTDENVTLNNVNRLLREGLKLKKTLR